MSRYLLLAIAVLAASVYVISNGATATCTVPLWPANLALQQPVLIKPVFCAVERVASPLLFDAVGTALVAVVYLFRYAWRAARQQESPDHSWVPSMGRQPARR